MPCFGVISIQALGSEIAPGFWYQADVHQLVELSEAITCSFKALVGLAGGTVANVNASESGECRFGGGGTRKCRRMTCVKVI